MSTAPTAAVIGICAHCHLPLYDAGPVAAEGPLAHVACAVDHTRRR